MNILFDLDTKIIYLWRDYYFCLDDLTFMERGKSALIQIH